MRQFLNFLVPTRSGNPIGAGIILLVAAVTPIFPIYGSYGVEPAMWLVLLSLLFLGIIRNFLVTGVLRTRTTPAAGMVIVALLYLTWMAFIFMFTTTFATANWLSG
ncbi:MAG: hypothetical protein HY457_01190 [Parcubacteria group bacterium]|nr:hypothetical protein [Parcubacteria group bacterium]